MAILFVNGVNDRSEIRLVLDQTGAAAFQTDGNCFVYDNLPLQQGVADRLLIFGSGVRQHSPSFEQPPSLIFNQIAEADTHRGALERCAELCDRVDAPVINHPRNVLQTTRERVAKTLDGIAGVRAPRTWRFQPRSPDEVFDRAEAEGLDFPFVLRTAGEHLGRRMLKVDGREGYASMHPFPFDGRDFYLIEYLDAQEDDGFHHKHRLVVIDGEPVLRHALYNRHWLVHEGSTAFMQEQESVEDEPARLQRLATERLAPLRPAIDEIANRLGLEFFGIDCSLRPDGTMALFEANALLNLPLARDAQQGEQGLGLAERMYRMLEKYSGEKLGSE
jgi:hypothetical protein